MVTPHLRRLIRRKNKLHARLKKTGSGRLRALWRRARSKGLSAALRIARDEYVNNAVGDIKSNPKPFWKFIRSQRKDNQAMPPLKTPSDHLAESDLEKAESLNQQNQQFQQNFSNEDTTAIPFFHPRFPKMPDITVTCEGVQKLLAGLKITKSAGPDNLHPYVLKESAGAVAPILKHIFQKSLDTGHLPRDWCIANICPIFKKGDRSNAGNYRPISLTSVACKLLEHFVCSNLMTHLEKYHILTASTPSEPCTAV